MAEARLATLDVRAAAYAGVAAGTLATLVQVALWWVAGDALLPMLLRDTRLTAAIVLGRDALRPTECSWTIMATATLLHYSLSIAYSLLLAGFIAGRESRIALLTGAAFGLALFVTNLYGFTLLFPWFAVARDWITLLAHAVFGISSAACYQALTRAGFTSRAT